MLLVWYRWRIVLLYPNLNERGWLYLVVSLPVVILVHDAYFYWTHRMMHHRALYRYFHVTHHKSRAPSSWAAYGFDPSEAVVQSLYLPLFTLAMPLHYAVYGIFLLHMLGRNVLGHCGYEILPRRLKDNRLLWCFTTTTHHDLHHSHQKWNYGLYFTWWDRWMGTEYPLYREVFELVTDPRSKSFRMEVVEEHQRQSKGTSTGRSKNASVRPDSTASL